MRCPTGTREARTHSVVLNLTKMILQTSVMWGVFLFLLPAAIWWAEELLGLDRLRFSSDAWRAPAVCLFSVAGGIGLFGGVLFATHGRGTPLPLDTATHFIVLGPYRFVRNPMALGGIIQGICVGAFLGSFPVMVYSLTGAVAWHIWARPWEEADLERRFGPAYLAYKQEVPLWTPRFRPYPRVTGVPSLERQDGA